MEATDLEKIGLTKNQSLVYLSLLKLGSTTAQEIMKESGLHSSRVYESLEKLQKHGLTSYVIKDYKKYFQAAKPKKLLDFLDEKKEIANQILPDLEKLEGMKTEQISASIYKGKEGLKTIHSEMLKKGKDIRVIGAKGLIFSELQYFMPNFERDRVKRKIKWIELWDTSSARKTAEAATEGKLIEGKILPKGAASNGVVNIFGSKVAIVLWKEKYPTAFMIDNKDIANAFRKWFNVMMDKSN